MTATADVALSWRPAPLAGRLATVGVLALLGALLLRSPALAVVAAPCLGALAAGRRRRPGSLPVSVSVSTSRCVEDEPIEVAVSWRAQPPLGGCALRLVLPERLRGEESAQPVLVPAGAAGEVSWVLRPPRWGRWTLGPLRLVTRSPGRLELAEAYLPCGELAVYPPAALAQRLPVPPLLLERFGAHGSRRAGHGVEFAGVRPYVTGDVVRRVNWAVSARRGRLHVTQFAAERAADVVLVVDATSDVGPVGASSLDLAVRGTAGIAQSYLRAGDRVGVVALGGPVRWMRPAPGARQLYRVVEAVLDMRAGESYVDPSVARLPRTALPAGALVIVLTPLVDVRVIEALRDLRQRAHPVVAVDLLRSEPVPRRGSTVEALALRLWRLERIALTVELEAIGVVVVPWGDDAHAPGLLDRVALRMDPRAVR